MPSKQADPKLIVAIENLFILQALQAGMKTEDIRQILKIDMNRVTAVSRHFKAARKR